MLLSEITQVIVETLKTLKTLSKWEIYISWPVTNLSSQPPGLKVQLIYQNDVKMNICVLLSDLGKHSLEQEHYVL